MSRLLLFDIDCTLIDTGGAGMAALKEAACELFRADGPELDLAGSTDSGIVRGILEHFGSNLDLESFYEVYLSKLEPNLAMFNGRVLPGVSSLLAEYERRDDVSLGLLTGNMTRGAKAKMLHYDLDQYFAFGAYGDDHDDRNLLGPIALERAEQQLGQSFASENCVVIGDTPKDIACGKAMGAITLAVATGRFSTTELAAYSPDHLLEDLTSAEVFDILG